MGGSFQAIIHVGLHGWQLPSHHPCRETKGEKFGGWLAGWLAGSLDS
jgi:hypothetical protein